jgi:hypothetical protein
MHPDGRVWFIIFVIGYLEKGAHGVSRTLKQGEQENFFVQYLSLNKQFEIRTLGDKQRFDHKNLARSSNLSQSM